MIAAAPRGYDVGKPEIFERPDHSTALTGDPGFAYMPID
jgi:hypothetical protein